MGVLLLMWNFPLSILSLTKIETRHNGFTVRAVVDEALDGKTTEDLGRHKLPPTIHEHVPASPTSPSFIALRCPQGETVIQDS